MSALLETINEAAYRKLISKTLPRVIETEEQNDRYVSELESLHDRGDLTAEEEKLSQLLTLLIEDFENRHYPIKAASPVDIVRELMEANNLRQADLLDVFGTPSVVSEVLSGKRDLSKAHIQKLSARFHVSPELFFAR